MTCDLESALRSAAKSGRLNYISVGFSNGVWSASYRGVDDRDGRICDHKDVVVALTTALTHPRARRAPVAVEEDLL